MAEIEKKISALTELAEFPAVGDMHPIVDVSDTTQAASGTTKKVSHKNLLGYTEYVALLTQSGTDAPTATVVKNDTGATVSYGRSSAGQYTATCSAEILTAGKTIVLISQRARTLFAAASHITTTQVGVYTSDQAGTAQDNVLLNTAIVIRIYV